MKKVAALALVLSLFGTFAIVSDAEARPYWKKRVNVRQNRQQKRIFNGTTGGSLTMRENRNLQNQQAKLAATEARFRASGNGLTKNEAARLEVRQDAYSQNIYKQKHDNQVQPQ